jgi:hypothetical protein
MVQLLQEQRAVYILTPMTKKTKTITIQATPNTKAISWSSIYKKDMEARPSPKKKK